MKPFRKRGPVAKKIASGEITIAHDVTYDHDRAVCERLLTDGLVARKYADQIDKIGHMLVRAGILTRQKIRRRGVFFAIRDHFEPMVARSKKK